MPFLVSRVGLFFSSNLSVMWFNLCMQDPSLQQRQEALYLSTCAHAYTGDVEFAQVTLRGGVAACLGHVLSTLLQLPHGGYCNPVAYGLAGYLQCMAQL